MLPTLESPRLVYAELAAEDAPALKAYQNQEAYWRLQAMEPAEFAEAERRVAGYLAHRGPDEARRLFVYVAREKAGGRVVGQVSLSRSAPAVASLGFGVDPALAGRGFATEMALRLIDFGFERVGLHRIAADVAVENRASARVVAKAGLKFEGISRDCIHAQGRWWTEARYARLATDPAPRRLTNY